MRLIQLFILIFCTPQLTLAETLVCNQFFQLAKQPVMTEYHIEFNDSDSYKILRNVNRVFVEYSRDYMENTKTEARITVPESRWMEIFKQDYETVIQELSKVEIYKVDTYEDGTQTRVFDANLLVSYSNDELKTFRNEWIPTQRSFSFQFDRRILRLMEIQVEPAYVGMILKSGVIRRIKKDYDSFMYY